MTIFILGLLLVFWIVRLIRHNAAISAAPPRPGPMPGTTIPELARHLTDPGGAPLTNTQATRLRPLVLHWLGLRTDLTPAQAAEQVPGLLRRRWFMLDLQHLSSESDPHAAIAFACLRVAFYLRAAWLLGWLDHSLYTRLTAMNARRLRDCFPDWPSFTRACAQDSAHWQARGRTDVFGEHLNPERLCAWLWIDPAPSE